MENSNSMKVLIFEDISGESELIQHEIRKAKIPVVFQTAFRKNDFLEKISSFHPDIVISDDSNQELSGMRVITIVRCNLPDAEFIVLGIEYCYRKIAEYCAMGAYFISYDHIIFLPSLVKRLYRSKSETSDNVQEHDPECTSVDIDTTNPLFTAGVSHGKQG